MVWQAQPAKVLSVENTEEKPSDTLYNSKYAEKESWVHYQHALEAIEAEEWLLASHYFDLSLRYLIDEKKDSTNRDSVYELLLTSLIIENSEEAYAELSTLGENAATWTPYELALEGIEEDEKIGDSSSLKTIESFLETLDLSEFSFPVELNERVLQEIYYFTERVPSFIKNSLNRKTAYDSLIYSILKEYEMPEDLIYLSLVESGFKVKAYSRAKASGLWQFIPATGERFGLKSDFWVDMRRHPEKATRAAAAYLNYLYSEFGDWLLAMAAYNCGEGRVRRLIREIKQDSLYDSTKAITYWDLKLPKETMHYVPRILAAMIIGHYPEHYNIQIEKQSLAPFDTVTITDCFPLSEIAKVLSIYEDSVHALNMELIRWATPPDAESFVLRIPKGTREKFLASYDKMDKNKVPKFQYHKVKKREYLGLIARKYGVKIKDIQQANNMKSTRLRVGQRLIIPLLISEGKPIPKKKVYKKGKIYKVKESDTKASIARRFGVSVKNLNRWNNWKESENFTPDTEIFVSEPSEEQKDLLRKQKLENGFYTVSDGDSYLQIAIHFGVDLFELMELNNGTKERLQVGQKLKIPKPKRVVKQEKPKQKKEVKTSNAVPDKKQKKQSFYVVQSGDNLSVIASKFNVSVKQIEEWNNLKKKDNIYPGQKLKIRTTKAKDIPKTTRTHLVKKGESLWDIAKKYKTSIDEIVKWNKLSSTRIQAGQKLIINNY